VAHRVKVKQTGPSTALHSNIDSDITQTLCFPAARQSDCTTQRDHTYSRGRAGIVESFVELGHGLSENKLRHLQYDM
jgi:hypothetical protein